MEREEAYQASINAPPESSAANRPVAPIRYTYRHGDGSAEIIGAELLDATGRPVEIVETGEALTLRILARFNSDLDDPVVGFLIKNRHGIHSYGTNTSEQQTDLGFARRGETIEATFAFNCWLGIDQYSISLAVHSRAGESYDWIDGALFLRVTSVGIFEGVANLNAGATVRRRPNQSNALDQENEEPLQAIRA
jgi:lipopolysaccharide transport system ATP-binding protein